MFTVRRIKSNGEQQNTVLGETYNLVEKDSEKFNHLLKKVNMDFEDKIFSFLVYKNGSKSYPLYNKSTYYIMVDGKTTQKLQND